MKIRTLEEAIREDLSDAVEDDDVVYRLIFKWKYKSIDCLMHHSLYL